jgi:pimeloyl-[acyl-carrier protein] methyl ester esterase
VTLLLRHGWALDRTLWDGVLAALDADADVVDAGYYGRPAAPPAAGERMLGVGHSLGALELLAEPPPGLVGMVAIDGFARFGQAEDFPQGTPARVLGRMALRVEDGGLAAFVQRAGGAVPAGTPDGARLRAGLDRLATLDGRACRLPVWRLHATDDPIAPLAMADASFAGLTVIERRLRPTTDHLSPIHNAQACADLIRAALAGLT